MHPDLNYAGKKLHLLGTRVIGAEHHVHEAPHQHHIFRRHRPENHLGSGPNDGHVIIDDEEAQIGFQKPNDEKSLDRPEFRKNEAATNFELFYDLWFVANLNVFGGVHEISDEDTLLSFICYIILLWTTWGVTTLFDVRFTADSVLERACKAVHLGVMVGFAEMGPSFNPDDQIKSVFQTMSFFLAASRFVLACQYGYVAWQVRRYVEDWRPITVTAALHLIAAAVYFGIAFRYEEGKNSKVYVVWFVVGVVELKLHLILSQLSEVLTFLGTHLGERMNLLTLIIVGEGAILLAKNVTLLVKDTYLKDHALGIWSPSLIGIVTCAAALIYTIFQLYFDWMHEDGMSVHHQVSWTSMHLPFHIALVLFLEGANQFILWARLKESINTAVQILVAPFDSGSVEGLSSKAVSKMIGEVVYKFLAKYPPNDMIEVYDSVGEKLGDISELPDSLWDGSEDSEAMSQLTQNVEELGYTMVNAIYHAFGIDAEEEDKEASNIMLESEDDGTPYMASEVNSAIQKRFRLVFIYAFTCAGIVLLYLVAMHILSKRRGWTPFNMLRTAICAMIGLALALIPTMAVDMDTANRFIGSSWMLPTITLGYVLALIITHLPHPRRWGMGRYMPNGLANDGGGYKKQQSHIRRLFGRAMCSRRKQQQHMSTADVDMLPVDRNFNETHILVHLSAEGTQGADSIREGSRQASNISQAHLHSHSMDNTVSSQSSRDSLDGWANEPQPDPSHDQIEYHQVNSGQQQQLDTEDPDPTSTRAPLNPGYDSTFEQGESAGHINTTAGQDRLSRD